MRCARARALIALIPQTGLLAPRKCKKSRDLTPMSFRVDNPSLFRLVHSYMYRGGGTGTPETRVRVAAVVVRWSLRQRNCRKGEGINPSGCGSASGSAYLLSSPFAVVRHPPSARTRAPTASTGQRQESATATWPTVSSVPVRRFPGLLSQQLP